MLRLKCPRWSTERDRGWSSIHRDRDRCVRVPGVLLLEHFRNTRRLFESRERRLFLRKKPLECVLSVYTNSENAIARHSPLRSTFGPRMKRMLPPFPTRGRKQTLVWRPFRPAPPTLKGAPVPRSRPFKICVYRADGPSNCLSPHLRPHPERTEDGQRYDEHDYAGGESYIEVAVGVADGVVAEDVPAEQGENGDAGGGKEGKESRCQGKQRLVKRPKPSRGKPRTLPLPVRCV